MNVLVLMKAVTPCEDEGLEWCYFDVVSQGGRHRTCEGLCLPRTTEAKRRKAIVEWVARAWCAEVREVRFEERGAAENALAEAAPVAGPVVGAEEEVAEVTNG